jgi:hypothetical protein
MHETRRPASQWWRGFTTIVHLRASNPVLLLVTDLALCSRSGAALLNIGPLPSESRETQPGSTSGFETKGTTFQYPDAAQRGQSFRATSGPVIRLRRGNVAAMIASEAASPPTTVAQYAIPGMLNAMPTWEWR